MQKEYNLKKINLHATIEQACHDSHEVTWLDVTSRWSALCVTARCHATPMSHQCHANATCGVCHVTVCHVTLGAACHGAAHVAHRSTGGSHVASKVDDNAWVFTRHVRQISYITWFVSADLWLNGCIITFAHAVALLCYTYIYLTLFLLRVHAGFSRLLFSFFSIQHQGEMVCGFKSFNPRLIASKFFFY